MSLNPIIVPAHRIWSYGNTPSGPIEPTYELAWGTDGNSARPLHAGGNSATYSVALGGRTVNFVSLINSTVRVNTVVGGAGANRTMPANPLPPHEISPNPYLFFSAVAGVGSVSFSIGGNPELVIIGQLIAGQAYQLNRPFPPGTERSYEAKGLARDDDWGMWPGHDMNAEIRELQVQMIVKDGDLAELRAAWQAQLGYSLPSVIVPRPDRNDAWYGFFRNFRYSRLTPYENTVSFTFRELVRCRW